MVVHWYGCARSVPTATAKQRKIFPKFIEWPFLFLLHPRVSFLQGRNNKNAMPITVTGQAVTESDEPITHSKARTRRLRDQSAKPLFSKTIAGSSNPQDSAL